MMGFLHLFFVMFLITEDMNLSNPVEITIEKRN